MSVTVLFFIVIVAVEIIAGRSKAKRKELQRKMRESPVDNPEQEEAENVPQGVEALENLRKLLTQYAEDHPDDPGVKRYAESKAPVQKNVPTAPAAARPVSVEQIQDVAIERRRIAELMRARRGRIEMLVVELDATPEESLKLKQKCFKRNVSDEDFERILMDFRLEYENRKERRSTNVVPDDCEMQHELRERVKDVEKNPIRAKAPVLQDEGRRIVRHAATDVPVDALETKRSKPKFRLTVAEARRGIILSKILDEPRYRKRWSPLSR